MINGINHITLAVNDLDRSFQFYVGLLGCTAYAKWQGGAYLTAGELWLCLSVDSAKPTEDYSHLAFTVSEAEFKQHVQVLQEAGVEQWKRNTSAGDSFYFLDPDGHKLELHTGNLFSRLSSVDGDPYAGWQRFK